MNAPFQNLPHALAALKAKGNEQLIQIARPRSWDYEQLGKVLALGATLGKSVPTPPESIHLGFMRRVSDELIGHTVKTGREHARTAFSDLDNGTIRYSPKISRGSKSEVLLDWTPPNTHASRHLVGTIANHTHPIDTFGEPLQTLHFSDMDYKALLGNPTVQLLVVSTGKNILLALKTSSTPQMDEPTLSWRLSSLHREFIGGSLQGFKAGREFTKTAALEFGLSLYLSTARTGDLAERLSV